jgi:hypothetical protein
MPDDTPFKQGDKVRHKTSVGLTPLRAGEVYEVLGVHDVYIWRTARSGGMPVVGVAAVYEKVIPFFEPGKTYWRHAAWSITAQAEDVTERFECKQVEENSGGQRVAFGRIAAGEVHRWATLHKYEHDNHGWEEV